MNALSTGYWGRKDRNRIKGKLRERVEGKIIKVNNKVKIIKRAVLYALSKMYVDKEGSNIEKSILLWFGKKKRNSRWR